MASKIVNGVKVDIYKFGKEYRLTIGMNTYCGFKTRKDAVTAINNYI